MPAADQDCVFRFGGYTLDLPRGLLLHGETPIFLRPKAFALLAHLAQRQGRVVSKSDLIDAVWPDVIVTEDSLTQTVREVRRATGDPELIRTVTKRGYMLAGAAPAAATLPVLAVLRFANESGNREDDPLIDGFVEDILNGLARFRSIVVLARNTSFADRSSASGDLPVEGPRTKAEFFVAGAVRRAGSALRVSVKLVDAPANELLWGERFEAEGADIFRLQDEIVLGVVNRLMVQIEDVGIRRSTGRPTTSLDAYELLLHGIHRLRGYGEGDNLAAKALFEAALERDPSYGLAHSYLALARLVIAGYEAAPADLLSELATLAGKGVALVPREPRCHRILALVNMFARDFALAEGGFRRALQLNPGDADTMVQAGYLLATRGRFPEALELMMRGFRLNPLHPNWYLEDRSLVYFGLAEYRLAIADLEALPHDLSWLWARRGACHALVGEAEAAARCIQRARQVDRHCSDADLAHRNAPFEHAADRDRLAKGIEMAIAAAKTIAVTHDKDPSVRS